RAGHRYALRGVEGEDRHQRPADHERPAQSVRLPQRNRPRSLLPALRHRRAAPLPRGGAQPPRFPPPPAPQTPPRRCPPPPPRAVRKKLLQEVADRGPRSDFDIAGLRLRDGTQLAQSGRPRRVRDDDDYTKFVKPEYELGCDVGERRSREFWQRRFGVTPD